MSKGTLSSTEINLNSPDYAFAKNDPYIVGLLNDGWRWGSSGNTDGSETQVIHYAFAGSNWDPGTAPDQEIFVASALQAWANVANLQFDQVTNVNDAEIVFNDTTQANLNGFVGYSGTPNQAQTDNTTTNLTKTQTLKVGDLGQVDTYYATDANDFTSNPSATNWGPNSAAWVDVMHEIGHALGLKHPFDSGSVGDGSVFPGIHPADKNASFEKGTQDLNEVIDTIMSYNFPDNLFNKSANSPMALDIAAIQTLYGANTNFHNGDDTYVLPDPSTGWGNAGEAFTCLWDTGGIDQVVYNGTAKAIIDLRPATVAGPSGIGGHFSYTEQGTKIGAGFSIADDVRNALPDQEGVTGVIIENASGGGGDDVIRGNDVDNILQGNGGADTIIGYGGNDHLYGGLGHDLLEGGKGDDTYFFDSVTGGRYDSIIENKNEGIDTVDVFQIAFSGVNSYTLGDNVENGNILGANGFTLNGNSLGNDLTDIGSHDTLFGDAGDDILEGTGTDFLRGGTSSDTYILEHVVDGSYDTVAEGMHGGTDTVEVRKDPSSDVTSYTLPANVEDGKILGNDGFELDGNNLDNTLWGGTGSDQLYGNGGKDSFYGNDDALNSGSDADPHTVVSGPDDFYGGLGDDNYYLYEVDYTSHYSVVHENADEGTDTVHVMAAFNGSFMVNSYTMTDNVEVGIVDSAYEFNLTGNDIGNNLFGNDGNDTLIGLGGSDFLKGNAGYDTLYGGAGDDTYVLDSITEHVGGTEGVGGTTEYDLVSEIDPSTHEDSGGQDTVLITAVTDSNGNPFNTYQLPEFVENGTVIGGGGMDLVGNDLENTLSGNTGNDTLDGGSSSDTLIGGGGRDILIGGFDTFTDTFVYNSISDSKPGAAHRDLIEDFTQGGTEIGDVIDLSAIDANSHAAGNQAFHFIGTDAFSSSGIHHVHVYGQLRAETVHGTEGDFSVLQADVNGDGKADFEIEFNRVITFTSHDFVL